MTPLMTSQKDCIRIKTNRMGDIFFYNVSLVTSQAQVSLLATNIFVTYPENILLFFKLT